MKGYLHAYLEGDSFNLTILAKEPVQVCLLYPQRKVPNEQFGHGKVKKGFRQERVVGKEKQVRREI